MFKVAYVVPIIAPYAIPRYQELAKVEGVEVHVIVERATNPERKGWEFHEIKGCYTHILNSKNAKSYQIQNKKDRYKIDQTRYYSTGLRSKIREINPDVVLVCNSTQIMFLLGPRKYKLGVVVEDTLRAAEGRSKINSIIKQIMLKRADFYIPFSKDAIEFLKFNDINQPLIRSYWSMETEFFTDLTQDEKQTKKKEFGMRERTNYILIANLIPRKGIKQFIAAWSKMSNEFQNNSELFVLGDGPLKGEIIDYISAQGITNIHIVGSVPYKEVSYYLQCGDVFVLPTLEDLCSLSVLEAMASELPVLTTIYNGARQFVNEGENGYIFDPTNESSIIDVLEKINSADLRKMSTRSAELVKRYSTEKVMRKLYMDIIQLCNRA